MSPSLEQRLKEHGIRPSLQRMAIAAVVLETDGHLSAEEIHEAVGERSSVRSLATVYNTLHLFVERGLLREVRFEGDRVLYDRNTQPHHHLVDLSTGELHDLPVGRLRVEGLEDLDGWVAEEIHVVVRARRTGGRPRRGRRRDGIDRITP